MKCRLSDQDLIEQFVQDSRQNREVLLANSNLTAQSIINPDQSKLNQLLSKSEGLVASSRLDHDYPEFMLRHQSSYWVQLNHILAEHSFLPIHQSSAVQQKTSPETIFSSYQYVKMPPGYRMSCTKGLDLWRKWWQYSRKIRHQKGISLDLLVRVRQTWYPIQDLVVSNGLLFIKTLVDEKTLHGDDLVVWLEKEKSPSVA